MKHPNIVSVHEVGREGESVYIVSDFVRGVTLGDWLTGQQLTNREAAELCATIAAALHHAHESGVVHRDLKPANIMMDGDGEPHLMDFGLARRDVGEVTVTVEGQILGTPAYMSPEQAQGEGHSADRRSDVYSLGVVLFQLLTGELPFRGNARMLVHQVINDEPPSPRKLNANIRKDLETMTLKCLEKNPALRYQTAQDLADELRRFLAGDPIYARPISPPARAVRWAMRNPAVAALSGSLIVSLATGLIAMASMWRKAEFERARAKSSEASALASELRARKNEETAKRLEQLANLRMYGALLTGASHAWEADDAHEARALLDRCPNELRGWEHDYLSSLLTSNQIPLAKHQYTIRSISFSPDSQRVASGSSDGMVKLTSIDPSHSDVTFKAHSGGVYAIEFFSDGKRFATAGGDNFLRVWDAKTGQQVAEFDAVGDVVDRFEGQGRGLSDLAISPDGELLGYGCAFVAEAHVIRLADGQPVAEFKTDSIGINCVAFSPDGQNLLVGDRSGLVYAWNVEDGVQVLKFQPYPDGVEVVELAVAKNSGFIVSGSRQGNSVDVWEFPSGKRRCRINMQGRYRTSLGFSPDGSQIVTAETDGFGEVALLRFWDSVTGAETGRLKGLFTEPLCVAFSPDGKWIASGGGDLQVTLWEAKRDQQARTLADVKVKLPVHPYNEETVIASGVAYSADGRMLASCYSRSGDVAVWEVDSGTIASTLKGAKAVVEKVALSQGNKLVAAGDRIGWVYVWDRHSAKQIMALEGFPSDLPPLTRPRGDGKEDRIEQGYRVTDVGFSHDGKRLIASSDDGSVGVWDIPTGTIVFRIRTGESAVVAARYTDDGSKVLTLNGEGLLQTWSADIGAKVKAVRLENKSGLSCAAWSPDETWIVAAEEYDLVSVWDAQSGERLATFNGLADQVFALHASPDGRRVASCGSDRLVRIWDVAEGTELLSLRGHEGPAFTVAFSPDGKALASGGAGGIRLWETAN